MTNTPIENIYYDYTDTEEFAAHSEIERVAEDAQALESFLQKLALPKAACNELSDLCLSVEMAYQTNGFVLGFEYAVKVLTQCGIGVNANA